MCSVVSAGGGPRAQGPWGHQWGSPVEGRPEQARLAEGPGRGPGRSKSWRGTGGGAPGEPQGRTWSDVQLMGIWRVWGPMGAGPERSGQMEWEQVWGSTGPRARIWFRGVDRRAGGWRLGDVLVKRLGWLDQAGCHPR